MPVKSVVTTLPISDLKVDFYVRSVVSEARVDLFAKILNSGGSLPPVLASDESKTLIDGRTRMAAYLQIGRTEIPVELIPEQSRKDMLVMAMKANIGGSEPPKESDFNVTIRQLVELKVSRKEIVEILNQQFGLPKEMGVKLLDNVLHTIKKINLKAAASLVISGEVTLESAAEQKGVKVEDLKRHMSGGKDPEDKDAAQIYLSTLRNINGKQQDCRRAVGQYMGNMMNMFNDGVITLENMQKLITNYEAHIEKEMRNIRDWQDRLNKRVTGVPAFERHSKKT